jgi:hypothetical protein
VAELALRAGEVDEAARRQLVALRLGLEHGSMVMVAYSLIVAARFAAGTDEWEDALDLGLAATSMLHTSGIALYDHDQALLDDVIAKARAELGVDALPGRSDDVNEVVDRAAAILHRHIT